MSARSQPLTAARSNVSMSEFEATGQFDAESRMRRILLVDDQAHVLRVLRVCLDRNGYEVDTALSGEIALRMMKHQHYDVLITDIDLPGMATSQLCECAHRQLATGVPFTLVIAGHEHQEQADHWLSRLPDTETLDRPVSLRYLVARLSEHFGDFDRRLGDGTDD